MGLLLLSGAGALYFALHAYASNDRQVHARLEVLAHQVADELQQRFRLYEYGLRGARGAVIAAGNGEISCEAFARYMESSDIEREFPGSRGFGFIARVAPAKLDSFLAQVHKEGRKNFTIRELGPNAGDHFIIKCIEPLAPNAAAVGLDLASEKVRREAAVAAMQGGKATLTGPITLLQASGSKRQSMLLLLPVYHGAQNRAPGTRDSALLGWVYTPLVTDDILSNFDQSQAQFGFTLSDVTEAANPVPFFSSRMHKSAAAADELSSSQRFNVYGRLWRVDIQAQPSFLQTLGLTDPRLGAAWIAGSGALLTIMLFVLLTARERRQRNLAQKARMATIVEDSHDAIIGTSLDGKVTEWNRAATDYFGYSAAEAIGHTIADLIVPPRLIKEDREIMSRAYAGESLATMESVRRHRNGSSLYVEISASPIRDGRGRVVGAAKTIRDITERKQTQRRILELNATLEEQVQRRTAELRSFSALQHAILNNAGYAIIATDPKGIITLFNPAAESMLGYAASELVGNESPGLFHDPIEVVTRAGELEAELGRYVEPGFEVFIAKAQHQPDAHEWNYVAKNGQRIPVLLNVSTLRRDDGELQGYLGIAVNLTERKRREAALEINERKLRGLFELSPLGIALTNARGQLIEFNESFRALTGYSDEELHALDYWTLTPAEYKEKEYNLLQTIEETGRYGPYDKHYVQKGGRHVPIRLNGVSLLIGNEPHIWSIVEDTTTQRMAETAMIDAVAAAESASKAKSEFLANMSHEIRTPMNAILGMLQLLQRTDLDSKQRDYASKTETAATTLLAILNDILDFSKIEAGRQTLESHDFELDRLLRDIAVILSANVGDKDVEVVFDVDKSIPKWLVGDSLRLQQVLINLAGNAVKFTHFGEVVLAVRLVEQSIDRITLLFEICDTGIGIARDKLTSIFEGFSQAEASTTRRFGGSGLGLAISQQLVSLMGGSLQVESELGHGSRFFFTIELEVAITRPVAVLPAATQRLHGLRTLVVDDNDSARAMLGEIIGSLDWTCDSASSGEQALQKIIAARAKGRPYDAIFMDWSMPGMDGWQTSQRIREVSDAALVPLIVMVTMHDRKKVAERTAQEPACVDGFLIKPVTASMLLDAVVDARAGRSVEEAHTGAAASSSRRRLGRLNGMLLLVVEDNQINQQVARELLAGEGARVDVAGGGSQAIRLLVENGGAYDAILMDIQMPDMDGYTATRRIRASLGFRTLPIIAMTANVLASDREACLSAGMNDHIGKPFDLDLVVERLLYWTGRSRAAAVAVRDASAMVPAQASAPTLDWPAALARFGGKQRAYLTALDRFPENAAELMQAISAAVSADHRDEVAALSHALKGIAGTVGASQVAELAASLEQQLRGTGGAWPGELPLDELRLRIDQAVAAARAIPIRHAATPATDAAGTPLDRAKLEELAALLQASNLRSIEWFEGMQQQLAAFPEMHHRMEEALTRLDMPAALIVCQQLLRVQQEAVRP